MKTEINLERANKVFLSLDEGVFGALYRVLIGFAAIPAMRLLVGSDSSDWELVPFLVVVLMLLRLVPIVMRRVMHFSADLLEAWYARRRMAKAYDSYQWRKLLWIGIGLALYVAISARNHPAFIELATFCLLAGALGLARWRAVAADDNLPKPVARQIKNVAA